MLSEMYAAEWWTVPKLPWGGGCRGSCGAGFEGGRRKEGGVLIVVWRRCGNGRHSGCRGRGKRGNGDSMREPTEDDYSKMWSVRHRRSRWEIGHLRSEIIPGSVNLIPLPVSDRMLTESTSMSPSALLTTTERLFPPSYLKLLELFLSNKRHANKIASLSFPQKIHSLHNCDTTTTHFHSYPHRCCLSLQKAPTS